MDLLYEAGKWEWRKLRGGSQSAPRLGGCAFMPLHVCLVGTVTTERGISTLGPSERLSGAASGRASRGPSQSQRHQRGAGPGLFPCLQLSPRRPLPPQPVQHSQQAVPTHWCVTNSSSFFFFLSIFCLLYFWPWFGCTSRVCSCPQVPYRCSWWAVWGCWRWSQAVVKGQLLCFPATALETQGHSWEAARDCMAELGQSAGKQPARQMSCPVSVFFYHNVKKSWKMEGEGLLCSLQLRWVLFWNWTTLWWGRRSGRL